LYLFIYFFSGFEFQHFSGYQVNKLLEEAEGKKKQKLVITIHFLHSFCCSSHVRCYFSSSSSSASITIPQMPSPFFQIPLSPSSLSLPNQENHFCNLRSCSGTGILLAFPLPFNHVHFTKLIGCD